jgi:tight adherence protein C
MPLIGALQPPVDRTLLEPLARFVDGLLVAIKRGMAPLAEVLRAQAPTSVGRQALLLEAGGRKEITMMVTSVERHPSTGSPGDLADVPVKAWHPAQSKRSMTR